MWSKRKFYTICVFYYVICVLAIAGLEIIRSYGIISSWVALAGLGLLLGSALGIDKDILMFSYRKYRERMVQELQRRRGGTSQ